MPKSHRHRRAALRAPRAVAQQREYEIVDPHFQPDLRGEFAGMKPYRTGGTAHRIRLSDRAAKFYLDQGALRLVEPARPGQSEERPAGRRPEELKRDQKDSEERKEAQERE